MIRKKDAKIFCIMLILCVVFYILLSIPHSKHKKQAVKFEKEIDKINDKRSNETSDIISGDKTSIISSKTTEDKIYGNNAGIYTGNLKCYMNSILQCLITMSTVYKRIILAPMNSDETSLLNSINCLFNKYTNTSVPLVDQNLENVVKEKDNRFPKDKQADAAEFFGFLLTELKKENCPLDELKISIENVSYCKKCDGLKILNNEMYLILLYVRGKDMQENINNSITNITPMTCACGEALCITNQSIKTGQYLCFEILDEVNSDISEIMTNSITIQDMIYNLIACVFYEGNGASGHYIAVCKRGNKIYTFNDKSVKETSGFILKKDCYRPKIMIYEQV